MRGRQLRRPGLSPRDHVRLRRRRQLPAAFVQPGRRRRSLPSHRQSRLPGRSFLAGLVGRQPGHSLFHVGGSLGPG
ncbi:MAG: hypothetical protein DRI34_09470, partial [Deltaproteobacteria bacterium]